jgi:hypothetical protein
MCEHLASAGAACRSWSLALAPHAGPPDWLSPAQLAMSQVLALQASAESASAHDELTALARHEASMLDSASADPVSLYLYRTSEERLRCSAASAAMVQMRVCRARGAAAAAYGLTVSRPGPSRTSAMAAFGASLLAELRTFVADEFTFDERREQLSCRHGVAALEQVLWAAPRLRLKPAPPPVLLSPAVTSEDSGGHASPAKGFGVRGRSSGPASTRDRAPSISVGVGSGTLGAGSGAPSAVISGAKQGAPGSTKASAVVQPGPGPAAATPSGANMALIQTTAVGDAGFQASISSAVPVGGSSLGPPLLSSDFMPLGPQPAATVFGDPWLQLHTAAESPEYSEVRQSAATVLADVVGLPPEAQSAAAALRSRALSVLSRSLAESVAAQDWDTAASAAGDLIEAMGSLSNAAPVQVRLSARLSSGGR